MAKVDIDKMSFEELRLLQEGVTKKIKEVAQQDTVKKIKELDDEEAKLTKRLNEIRAERKKLTGRPAGNAKTGRASQVSASVRELLSKKKQLSSKEIGAELDKMGIKHPNLAQTLQHLKKKGEIVSPARSVYALA